MGGGERDFEKNIMLTLPHDESISIKNNAEWPPSATCKQQPKM